jgi:hypothetical protein
VSGKPDNARCNDQRTAFSNSFARTSFTARRLSSIAIGFLSEKDIHSSAHAVPNKLLPTRILQVVSLQMLAIS